MSAGLIYRYFKSKSEIIQAIIERQLVVTRAKLSEMHTASADMATGIIASLDEGGPCDKNSMSGALFLEMSAEATRDPQIAAALAEFDAVVRLEIGHWLRRSKAQGGYALAPDIVPPRALLFTCLVEGLKLRVTREPTLDRALIKEALEVILPALLEPADANQPSVD
jgi:AcrR family transcriptional regulator